jgi:hypothetical protein
MMNKENKKLIDYSNYDGDYQQGELLGEDGQPIDLDELSKQQVPPKIPIVVKLGIVLILGLLGAGAAYFMFVKESKSPTPPPKTVIKRDQVLDDALKHLRDTRDRDFRNLVRCWELLARGDAKKIKLTQELVQKYCTVHKTDQNTHLEPRCEEDCAQIALYNCKDQECQAIANTKYIDLIYMMMQRMADGYNLLQAYIRIYQQVDEQYIQAHRRWKQQNIKQKDALPPPELQRLHTQVKNYGQSLKALWTGEGYDKTRVETSYLAIPFEVMVAQSLSRVSELRSSDPKLQLAKPTKKPRKGSKIKREKTVVAKTSKPEYLWGGTVVGWGSWPIKAYGLATFGPISHFRFETFDEIPFLPRDRADFLDFIDYNTISVNFWTQFSIQSALHTCASQLDIPHVQADVEMIAEALRGRIYSDTIQFKLNPVHPQIQKCVQNTLEKNLIYPGIPKEWEQITVKLRIMLFAQQPKTITE